MSNKDSKKIALFQDVIQQTIASPSGGYYKQYDRAVSRGIVHTSYWKERCYYTDWSQGCHMTPQLPHVFHTAHIVLSHPPSNPLACIAAQ